MQYPKIDNPESFYEEIPKDLVANIEYRGDLHNLLTADEGFQDVYLEMCGLYPPIAFTTMFTTADPQRPPGERNYPFILRPKQVEVVVGIDSDIKNGHDAGIKKSRKQGASEIVAKIYSLHAMLYPDSNFIVGSRKKEIVDNFGDNYTLFAKVDNVFEYLPSWMKKRFGIGNKATYHRKDMLLRLLKTNSTIIGETTNEDFSAGSRATSLWLDEFGRVDKSVAESIEGSVHDVAPCIIYCSTHWLGLGHTFNQCLKKETTHVYSLFWFQNPVEAEGLYTSPEPGIIEIIDEAYWLERYPELLSFCEK